MIAADQPTIFPATVRAAVSSIEDGSMKDGVNLMTPEAVRCRKAFLAKLSMPSDRAAIHFASFDTDDYCVYREATAGLMPGVDGAATDQRYQPILLPLADCTGAIIYDPVHHAVMVSHLGRHSTEQHGGVKSIEYMTHRFDSQPRDLLVWLSPSPNGADYPLWQFDNRSFSEVICEQLLTAGVTLERIEVSTVDTIRNRAYFSHSEFLKGNRQVDGRFAIAAMLR